MEPNNNQKDFEYTKLMSYIPHILSLITAICILSSLIYDHFYYSFFNITLLVLPTTIQDHLKSSISLLPTVLGLLIGLYVLETIDTRNKTKYDKHDTLTDDISDETILNCIVNNVNFPIPKMLKYLFSVSFIISIVVFIVSIYFHTYRLMLAILLLIGPTAMAILHWKVYMHPKVDKVRRRLVFNVSIFLLIMFVMIPAIATLMAWAESIQKNDVVIYFKDNPRKKLKAKILRNYEKSVFVGYSTNKIAILPQGDILMIENNKN